MIKDIFNEIKELRIRKICEKYNIKNYKINNGLVDVDGVVNLAYGVVLK